MQNGIPPNTILCRSRRFEIELDPSEIEERTGSMCLTVRVTHEGTWQSLRWVGRQMWVTYAALDAFEGALRSGREAVLTDMSDHPALRIVPGVERTHVLINSKGTRRSSDGEASTIELAVEPDVPARLAQALRDFPRWW